MEDTTTLDYGDFSAVADRFGDDLSSTATAVTAKIEILQIQHRQHDTRELKDLTRVGQFVAYLDSLEQALSQSFDHHEPGRSEKLMGPLWGSLMYLLVRAYEWDQGQALDKLLESYSQNAHSLELSAESWGILALPETLCVLYNVYENVTNYQLTLVGMVQPKSWKNTFKAHWAEFTSDLGEERRIVECCRVDSDFLKELRDAPHLYGSPLYHSQLLERITSYLRNRKNSLEQLDQRLNDKRAEQQREVFRWLAHDDYVNRTHVSLVNKIKESKDSSQWITKELTTWLGLSGDQDPEQRSPEDSKIWMYGKKGAGKSVLAAFVTEHCRSIGLSPSVFYCQEGNERANNCLAVLRGLLAQILQRSSQLLSIYYEKKRKVQGNELHNVIDAKSLLKVVLDLIPKQCFIIDGLDECIPQEMQQLLEFFRDLVNERAFEFPSALNIFISSTYLTGLGEYFGPSLELELTDALINPDIKRWIQTKVELFAASYNIEPHIIRGIVDKIFRRSEGMFLYADLAIKLLGQPTRNNLIAVADNDILPVGLAQAYAHIVAKLKLRHQEVPGKWEKARSILGWLTCARRPLKYHELSMILSFDPAEQTIDLSGNMIRVNWDDLCGSLVQLPGGDHVKLIHPTARQYLTEDSDDQPLKVAELQFDLCVLCLRYLCLDIFTDPDMPSHRREARCLQGHFAFQDYAASKWHNHLEILVRDCGSVLLHMDRVDALRKALDNFVLHYQSDLAMEPHPEFDENLLSQFSYFDFYPNLRAVWSFVFHRIKAPWEERKHISLTELKAAVEQNREQLEQFLPSHKVSPFGHDTIETYYGKGLFKCDRVDCYRFYDGFDSFRARKEHVRRHDRPFVCDLSGCMPLLNGFTSNKDLERHQRQYHPEAIEGPAHFVQPTRQTSTNAFTCELCDRQFTRHLSLESHKRNHYGDRPFPCSMCGRRFARINDARRHEKNGVCSGKAAARAGQARFRCECGQAFVKRAQLNAHRRTHHTDSTERSSQPPAIPPQIEVSGPTE